VPQGQDQADNGNCQESPERGNADELPDRCFVDRAGLRGWGDDDSAARVGPRRQLGVGSRGCGGAVRCAADEDGNKATCVTHAYLLGLGLGVHAPSGGLLDKPHLTRLPSEDCWLRLGTDLDPSLG